MYYKIAFAINVFILLGQRANSIPCNCGLGRGTDLCEKDCHPLVVRPQPLLPVPPPKTESVVCKKVEIDIPPLKPVGSLCSCAQTILTPAVVPKPPCASCYGSGSCPCGQVLPLISEQIDRNGQVILSENYCNYPPVPLPAPITIVEAGNRPPYAEADAVSQAIAYRKLVEQQNNKAEQKLSMGFQTLPREIVCNKKVPEKKINEGNLLLINGEVLEYKPPCAKDSSEEIVELPEDDEVPQCSANIRRLSLGDIGYGAVKEKPAQFIDVQPIGEVPSCGEAELLPQIPCNDGFKSGQVIIKEASVNPPLLCPEADPLPSPYPLPCRVNYQPCGSCGSCNSCGSCGSCGPYGPCGRVPGPCGRVPAPCGRVPGPCGRVPPNVLLERLACK